ncbi:hypothetical protein F383_10767 [Gossypium arboreum]|uniref:Uncharacterized protein n=1 Tax=Gossypium arboreum TaxID=29729 RepID=A0A0B0NQT6_GOSAR|nr:hypothetical protein F383_10767 [Gossypium arboreum]
MEVEMTLSKDQKHCLFPEQNLDENIPSTSTQHQWVRHDVDEGIYE